MESYYLDWANLLLRWVHVITAIGTWWVQLRAKVMQLLPDFPGKSRLPPYGPAQ